MVVKKKNVIILLFIIILFVCALFTRISMNNSITTSSQSLKTYYVFDDKFTLNNNTKRTPVIFKSTSLVPSLSHEEADIVFLSSYDNYSDLDKIENMENVKYVYGLRYIDIFANKYMLTSMIQKRFNDVIPVTIIIKNNKSYLQHKYFNEYGKPLTPLIIKSNIQRQEGVNIVTSIDDIYDVSKNYVIVQEVLKNPMLINNRKIDIRIYVLLVITPQKSYFYIYNNGFIYYTKEEYDPNSFTNDTVISSGYIDRSIYNDNPLTLLELIDHLGSEKGNRLKTNIIQCYHKVHKAYHQKLQEFRKERTSTFMIYGTDISPNKDCEVRLLEFNKGPDLQFKDKRDQLVKEGLIRDTMELISNPSKGHNHFIKIN